MQVAFRGELWLWPGDAAWHFISLPEDAADDIRAQFSGMRRGFGSVRVRVQVGESTWDTSIFPDAKSATYVLPVKRLIRDREGLAPGDVVDVRLETVSDGTS